MFVRSERDLNRLTEWGLAANASLLVDGKALPSRMKNIIESCEVNQRFERALR